MPLLVDTLSCKMDIEMMDIDKRHSFSFCGNVIMGRGRVVQ
jgi:hypothetical protein